MKQLLVSLFLVVAASMPSSVAAQDHGAPSPWWLAQSDDGTIYLVTDQGYYEVTTGTMAPELLAGLPDLGPVGPVGPNGSGLGPQAPIQTANGTKTESQIKDELRFAGYNGPWDLLSMLGAYNGANGGSTQGAAPPAVAPVGAAPPSAAPTSALPSGQVQTYAGQISKSADRPTYTFSASQGQLLQVHAERSSGIGNAPGFIVYDPAGKSEIDTTAYGCGGDTETRLKSSGTYRLAVTMCGDTGPYTVWLAVDRFGTLIPDSPLEATFGLPNVKDYYKFNGQQGQTVEVQLKRISGVGASPPYVLLEPGDLRTEAESFGGCSGPHDDDITLKSTGTYQLAVPYCGQGSYQVALHIR